MEKLKKIHAGLLALKKKVKDPEVRKQLDAILSEVEKVLKPPRSPDLKQKLLTGQNVSDLLYRIALRYAEHEAVDILLHILFGK